MKKFSFITSKRGSEYNFVREEYSSEHELKIQSGQHLKSTQTASLCCLPFLHQFLALSVFTYCPSPTLLYSSMLSSSDQEKGELGDTFLFGKFRKY